MNSAVSARFREHLRITWAITLKDVTEALKNRTVLSNIIIVLLMMVVYKSMPSWFLDMNDRDIAIYDPGQSEFSTLIEGRLNYIEAESRIRLLDLIEDIDVREIGLTIPANFDKAFNSGESIELRGDIFWWNRHNVPELQVEFESLLSEALEQPVRIALEEPLYPASDSMGVVTAAMSTVITIFFTGTLTIPHLMIEEKQSRTIESLLVSPADARHVVVGKAAAGLLFSLIMAAIVLAFNREFIIHWDLVILVTILGSFFSVSTGLTLGSFLENRQQMMIWSFIPAFVLLFPVLLSGVEPILPQAVRNVLTLVPTVAHVTAHRYALTQGATLNQILIRLAVISGWSAFLLGVVVWKVKRTDV
jgi:ABC-type multidrug transport system permease subunit